MYGNHIFSVYPLGSPSHGTEKQPESGLNSRDTEKGALPYRLPGDAVVMATVVATFALILSTSRPAVWIALEDTYYFVLRQLSTVGDFVKYVDSLY